MVFVRYPGKPTGSTNSTADGYDTEFDFSNDEAKDILNSDSLSQEWKSWYVNQFNNQVASDMASTANDFEANQAYLNREFQREMSNTQYQRAVQDLMKAGLNPALAYTQGGANAPSGATANSTSYSPSNANYGSGKKINDHIQSFITDLISIVGLGFLLGKKK